MLNSLDTSVLIVLDDTNYKRWYGQLEDILSSHDCESVIDDEYLTAEKKFDDTRFKADKKKVATARTVIRASISPEDQEYIDELTNMYNLSQELGDLKNVLTILERYS